jgi:hypothetical protein
LKIEKMAWGVAHDFYQNFQFDLILEIEIESIFVHIDVKLLSYPEGLYKAD